MSSGKKIHSPAKLSYQDSSTLPNTGRIHHQAQEENKSSALILKVGFPKLNRCPILQYKKIRDESQRTRAFEFIGEQGYRTAFSGHGVIHGHYYFEVEMDKPILPLPFIGVIPAVRVGFACLKAQKRDEPLGLTQQSYAYASNGRMINEAKYQLKQCNDRFERKYHHQPFDVYCSQ